MHCDFFFLKEFYFQGMIVFRLLFGRLVSQRVLWLTAMALIIKVLVIKRTCKKYGRNLCVFSGIIGVTCEVKLHERVLMSDYYDFKDGWRQVILDTGKWQSEKF